MSKKKNNKKPKDMQFIVMATILVLVMGLGVFAFISNLNEKEEVDEKQEEILKKGLSYEGEAFIGDENAPVSLVEFGDYKCPACKMWTEQVYEQLEEDYIKTGKVKVYFKHMAFLGPDSLTAASASEAVFAQNKDAFRDFYKAMYKNQGEESKQWATKENILEIVKSEVPNVDVDKLAEDIENETYVDEVMEDGMEAQALQVNSTPSIFVNGERVRNHFDYAELSKSIDDALKEK